MKKVLIILCCLFLCSCGKFEGGTLKPLQDDFDKFRINDIKYLYSIVQEYKQKTGYFPFEKESDEIPVIVIFESKLQASQHKGKYNIMVDLESRGRPEAPKKIDIKPYEEFYQEIDQVLAKKIIRKFDPQKVPTNKPCLYIYVVYKNIIDISAFLHNDLVFARKLSPFNNKLAISSHTSSYPDFGVWNLEELENQSEYKDFMSLPINKPGYDKVLEKEYN
ncbi:MAG: hypothetical protein KJ915_01945 [Candidatus Omnitrophica bacterium]|nr:hypothetical protein [Candidatus Omnitrophota bacterium]